MTNKELKKIASFVSEKCLEQFKVDKSNHILPLWNLSFAVICYTLERVAREELFFDTTGTCWRKLGNTAMSISAFHWEMMTESGLTVLFEGQTEETQIKIAELLGYKK